MGKRKRKRYSPKFKFQVVLEVLRNPGTGAEVARAFQVHPITVSKWKRELLEKGPEVFSGKEAVQGYESKIAKLERMLGKKEVELAFLKNFLGES